MSFWNRLSSTSVTTPILLWSRQVVSRVILRGSALHYFAQRPIWAHGVNDLIPGSYDGDPFERLMPGNLSVSAEQVVYRKVCIELLQELFDALPKKDRDILGKFYGVFGFEKTSLKEIGMYHMMKESAVEKAKERAVTKLKKAYPGSRLQIWRNVHRMIRRPILPAKDDRALRRSFTTSTLRNQESGRS